MQTERGAVLIPIARAAIAAALGPAPPGASVARQAIAAEDMPWLQQPGASFVTLTRHGQLRGCIGSLEARRTVAREEVACQRHDVQGPLAERRELDREDGKPVVEVFAEAAFFDLRFQTPVGSGNHPNIGFSWLGIAHPQELMRFENP